MDPLLFRSIERIVSVLIGGLSIFLGYRLFSSVRGQSDGKGTFKFPMHTSGVLTKVGPGVFFALFGAVAPRSSGRSRKNDPTRSISGT